MPYVVPDSEIKRETRQGPQASVSSQGSNTEKGGGNKEHLKVINALMVLCPKYCNYMSAQIRFLMHKAKERSQKIIRYFRKSQVV